MKNKILALVLCAFVCFLLCVPAIAANEEVPQLTLDFNKRYTDISEYEDVNDPYLDLDGNKEEKEKNRNIYVIILVVLLLIAVLVFVRALRKVPDEKTFEEKEKNRMLQDGTTDENKGNN